MKRKTEKHEKEISKRKRKKIGLTKSEASINAIFASIRDPFCIIDSDYRITRANEAYALLQQKNLSDLTGKVCHEVLHNKSNVCDGCFVKKTFSSGVPCSEEKMEISSDGVKRWYEITTYPIRDDDGTVVQVVEYKKDMTGRKKVEEALRESEDRYAFAARGANDGLWDWNLGDNKIYFSPRWKSMLGYGDQDIAADPEAWFSRVHPEDRSELEAKIAAHLQGRDSHFEDEYRIMHNDGTYRWMLSRGLAVRTDDNRAYRMAGSQTDITLRKNAEEQLLFDAFHDTLTGLPNRALFMDRLQHEMTISKRRSDARFAVLFVDLDRFKMLNDSLSHITGDLLLMAVGRKLSDCIRPGDTVARLGGDEFAILLKKIRGLPDAIDVTGRIHNNLTIPLIVHGYEVFTSASIGIAMGSERHERPEQVLRDAEIAMYQAKAKGRASYEIFDTKMHAIILDRQQLEIDLRHALSREELLLHYQPIVNLKTQRLIGFEALVRWNHPKRGLIYPKEFIPMAEDTGVIDDIGEWILTESCLEIKKLQEHYPADPPLMLSINISGKQFTKRDLTDKVAEIIRKTGVEPRTLAFEITESMIMKNVQAAVATMHGLREIGVHIHVDNFGTVYSSLNYLYNFPFDALKIDRAFIGRLSADGKNQNVIQSIISLANSLNLDVIAEGVELTHQLSTIKALKCQYGQGYLFAQPMKVSEIETWMKTEKILV